MSFKSPEEWLEQLRQIWLAQDVEQVPNLLSESFQYFESPFQAPLTKLSDVLWEWEAVRSQSIVELEVKPLTSNGKSGTAMYHFVQKCPDGAIGESYGAYYVELDDDGKAKVFRQWWMNKND